MRPRNERGSNKPCPQIEFSNVSKRYANSGMVLQALDLKIPKGEFVTLIGPSGCGKSTVLKLISGLTSPTQGAIRVDGMTPKDARETVSYIFQDATLLPWRPVDAKRRPGSGTGRRHQGSPRRKKPRSC